MKRKSFTLVEILVVIAVITILMGLLFPALGMVKEKAYMRQSLSDVKAIHMAIKSFKDDYGYLPDGTTAHDVVYFGSLDKATPAAADKNKLCSTIFVEGELKGDTTDFAKTPKPDTDKGDYLDLFNTLCYSNSDPTKSYEPPAGAKTLNPRKIKFLEPSKKFVDSDTKKRGYRDPWGRPYIIYLDTDYDGKILLPEGCGLPDNTFFGDVAVIGAGTYDFGTTKKLSDALKNTAQIVTSWK